MWDDDCQLLEAARYEFAKDGTLSTDTYMALNNAGINADLWLASLAGELDYE